MKSFVEQRPNGIAQMNTWIDNFYKTGKDEEVIVIPSPSPSVTPSTEPSVKPSASPSSKPTPAPTVSPTKKPVPNPGQTKKTAKTKVIRVSTVGKAQVTIVVSKKIIVKGKKKVKKITKKTSAKGVVSFKLSKKLTKGTKITVTVHKKGYKTKKKSIKIK